jgi:hypothetical protein
MKIGDKDYIVRRYPDLHPNIYAQLGENKTTICTNPNYSVRLKGASQLEHCVDMMLLAVAMDQHKHNSMDALHLAARYRVELEESRKAKRAKR